MTWSSVTSRARAWWRDAVVYQIYPRSWADSTGDGIGDLPGITARLDHVAQLGADAVWLSPFYLSPQVDHGYDVADYRRVDPLFGSLDDARALLARAHELGIRVIVDLVPNHCSSAHAWFQAALASPPGSRERARFLFREGKGEQGEIPPNDWQSVFGGPAWTRVIEADGTPGQWYLHLFDPAQPDFDWRHPEVIAEFHDILRFWLELGADGFRVDVASGLIKHPELPDYPAEQQMLAVGNSQAAPMWDQEEVHEIYRGWRRVLEEFNPTGDPARERILVAEAWVHPPERGAAYVRPDEMHQAFNFDYLRAPWDAAELRSVITGSLHHNTAVEAPTTWVLSNHDVVRHVSRLGLPDATTSFSAAGIGSGDPQPDAELGLRRGTGGHDADALPAGGGVPLPGRRTGPPGSHDTAR